MYGAPEEANAEHVIVRAVAVLAVVEQRDAVARLGEIREAVGRDLEARLIPGGVAMGGPLCGAVHRLEGPFVGAHVQGKESPQKDLALVPLDVRLDVHAPGTGQEPVGLNDARIPPGVPHPYRGAQGSRLEHLDLLYPPDLLAF